MPSRRSQDAGRSLLPIAATSTRAVLAAALIALATAGAAARSSDRDFGLSSFRSVVLSADRARTLASGDVGEKDWNGNKREDARQDVDLVVGSDAAGTDQISVWFNQYDNAALFTTSRTYARTAPNAVLSIAMAELGSGPALAPHRCDVVTGTRAAASGNVFTWETQSTAGNEGYLPSTYTAAYQTRDEGDVLALLLGDFAGGPGRDILAGTRSKTPGLGTLELLTSDDAPHPRFTRAEVQPAGSDGTLGEVHAMAVADLRGLGRRDLVVGTRLGPDRGQLVFFEHDRDGHPAFAHRKDHPLPGAVTCLAIGDVDRDGLLDVVVGLDRGAGSGALQWWRNIRSGARLEFALDTTIATPQVPLCMALGDLGGLPGTDLAVGFGAGDHGEGGVLLYPLDGGALHGDGVDPSGGALKGTVTGMTLSDFNDGVGPVRPSPPSHLDLAVAVSRGSAGGAVVLFIR